MADQPSQNTEEYYDKAYNNTDQNNKKPVARGGDDGEQFHDNGFWIIFIKPEVDIKIVWDSVSAATERGELGYMTSKRNDKILPGEPDYDDQAIFVFTYDSKDEEDINRVGDALEEMGYHKLKYKPKTATMDGLYYHLGDTNFCTYSRPIVENY